MNITMYILSNMKIAISIKVDEDVKRQAQKVASDAGLTLSALVSSYLTNIAATRRIELFAPEPMTPRLEKLIAEVEKERQDGKISKPFDSIDDFIADLNK